MLIDYNWCWLMLIVDDWRINKVTQFFLLERFFYLFLFYRLTGRQAELQFIRVATDIINQTRRTLPFLSTCSWWWWYHHNHHHHDSHLVQPISAPSASDLVGENHHHLKIIQNYLKLSIFHLKIIKIYLEFISNLSSII